jgi:hypothetical protein
LVPLRYLVTQFLYLLTQHLPLTVKTVDLRLLGLQVVLAVTEIALQSAHLLRQEAKGLLTFLHLLLQLPVLVFDRSRLSSQFQNHRIPFLQNTLTLLIPTPQSINLINEFTVGLGLSS